MVTVTVHVVCYFLCQNFVKRKRAIEREDKKKKKRERERQNKSKMNKITRRQQRKEDE